MLIVFEMLLLEPRLWAVFDRCRYTIFFGLRSFCSRCFFAVVLWIGLLYEAFKR